MTARVSRDIFPLPTDPAPVLPGRLRRLWDGLNARDHAVLHDLAALRLLTARQVERLRFSEGSERTQARRARACLERLHGLGLVDRLDRRIGGVRAGSAAFIYRLTPGGRSLVGMPRPIGGRHRHYPQPSTLHTDHTLAVSETAVRLTEADRAGHLDLVRFEGEPQSWRTYRGPAREPRTLHPDAFAIVGAGDWEHLWFLEIDLATEHAPVIRRKQDAYRAYAATGQEQQHWGVYPRVAYLTSTPARRDAIRRALGLDVSGAVIVACLHEAASVLAGTPAERGAVA